MQNEHIKLKKEDFSFVCPLKTEDMTNVEGGYFCAQCEKKVHDVTLFSPTEYEALKQKSNDLCITIKKVATVSLVLGLSACTPSKPVSERLLGKIAPNVSCDANVSAPKDSNRLTPFPVVDKNQTLLINRIEEPQIAGGISVMPLKHEK